MPAGRLPAIILAGLALSVSLPPPRPAQDPADRLPRLLIDFAAVLEDGTPVADLEPAEVEVRLEGRPRTLRSLRRVAIGPVPPAPGGGPVPPLPFGTNDHVVQGRRIALVVDEESFVAGREPLLRGAVEGLLSLTGPADVMAVVSMPFGGVKVAPTSDRALIQKAVRSVAAQGSSGESGSDLACRTRRFLEALDGFLQGEAGRSTPLTVVVFTAGMAAPRRDAPMALSPGMCELPITHFQRITAAAGRARASFYLLQPADIGMSASGWRETIAGADYLGSDNPLEGIEHLAGATGAVRLPLDATGTGSLDRVARETSAYYLAEIEPDPGEIYDRSRPIDVRVARRGISVRMRPEATFPSRPVRPSAGRLAVTSLLVDPEPFTELPLRAAGFTVREPGGQLRVGVVIETGDPASVLTAAGAVLLDVEGRVAARWTAPDAGARPLLGAMAVAPGRYRLRVAAVDANGRAGAAEDVIDARLATAGPLSLGSILLGVSRGQDVAPQLLFGAEPTAIASFDVYGGTAGMPLAITLDLARTLDGPAMLRLPLTMTRADETRVVATGAVPLGALPAGDYVVRATIALDDGTSTRVVRTLRKAVR